MIAHLYIGSKDAIGTMFLRFNMFPLFLLFLHTLGLLASPVMIHDPLPSNQSYSYEALERRDDTSWKPDYVLHVTNEPITLACLNKESVLIDGQHPGPLLRFKEGESKWVRVYNHLEKTEATVITNVAMHWHGIDVHPVHDGTPESQIPISAGHFRDYKITPPVGSAGMSYSPICFYGG